MAVVLILIEWHADDVLGWYNCVTLYMAQSNRKLVTAKYTLPFLFMIFHNYRVNFFSVMSAPCSLEL